MFPELKAIDNGEHFLPTPGKRNGTKCHQFLRPTWAQAVPKHLHVEMTTCSEARQHEDVLAPRQEDRCAPHRPPYRICVVHSGPMLQEQPHSLLMPSTCSPVQGHSPHLPGGEGTRHSTLPGRPPAPSLPRQLACREEGLLVALVTSWLGNPALLGVPFSWYGTVKTNIRYTDWTHLSLPETLHGSPLLLGQTPEPEPTSSCVAWHCLPLLLRWARWFPAPNLSSYCEATCDLRQLSVSPRETECLVLPSQ